MGYKSSTAGPLTVRVLLRGGFDDSNTAGDTTLTKKSGQLQRIDPNGAGRDVNLPAVTPQDDGYWFWIGNTADGAEDLTVKDASGATIGTVSQNESAVFIVDSAGVWQLFYIMTGAES